ncbi:MAG TPA: amidohydrolase family protein [Thermoanaerobaculia bacterium]|nr:amidohydrolase family protein [Thermoanaerobaculia bacterium]
MLLAAIVLTHVTLIHVATGDVTRDTTLTVESATDQTIDAHGAFVMPALWDMHVHLPDDNAGRDYLKLFVANGVTGLRVMEGSPELYRWRDAIERGAMFGPRMVVASAIIDGPKSFFPDGEVVKVSNAEEARRAVRGAKRDGADFIKVYDNLSRESYGAIIDEARRVKLPVEGHVPFAMSVADVSRAGQITIEHMMGIAAAGERVFPLLRKNGTWECPTLIMRHNYAYLDDAALGTDPRLKYVRASTRDRWRKMIGEGNDERKATFAREKALAGEMARAGVGILAGTDNGNPFVYPGFSIHDELALLVDAGLTPLQALQAATINAERVLRRTAGDWIVLDANPLDDIHNTTRIRAVIIRGKFLDRQALDALLLDAQTALASD